MACAPAQRGGRLPRAAWPKCPGCPVGRDGAQSSSTLPCWHSSPARLSLHGICWESAGLPGEVVHIARHDKSQRCPSPSSKAALSVSLPALLEALPRSPLGSSALSLLRLAWDEAACTFST